MRKLKQHFCCGFAAMAFVTAIAVPAHAQTAGEEAAADQGSDRDIVVTAQRREERLSDVPSSIAAYSQERLDVVGVRDFTDIAAFTPGVRIRDEQNQIAIRGLASNAGAATTGVYIDEVPIMARTFGEGVTSALPYVFDLERVEILRGPQGVLFGAGSLGGTVRYITPAPSTTDVGIYARAEGSITENGDPSYEAGAAVTIPVAADLMGLRLSGAYQRRGGWTDRVDYRNSQTIEENANWRENILLRGVANITPTSEITITPAIMWQKRYNNDTDSFYPFFSDVDDGKYRNANSIPLSDDDRFTLGSVTARYDGEAISLISTTSLFWRDQRRFYDGTLYELTGYENFRGELVTPAGPNQAVLGLPNFIVTGQIDNRQRNFTQEIRLQSTDGDAWFQWLIGGFYSNNRQTNVETYLEPLFDEFLKALYGPTAGVVEFYGNPLLANGASFIGNQRQRERQLAFFGNITLKPIAQLTLQAGLRWAQVDFDYNVLSTGPYIGGGRDFVSGATRERPVTPRFNASYKLSDDLMVYASASKGYRTGGLNGPVGVVCQGLLAAANRPVPPRGFGSDSAWSYEVGAKGGGRTVSFDASAFHINWKNIQQRTFLDPCSVSYTLNLGEAKSTGFDLAMSMRPTDGLSVELAVGYVDTRYSKTIYLTNTATTGPIRIAEGNAIAFSGTPWQASAAARYDFDAGGAPSFVRLQYDFNSTYNRNFPSQDPRTIEYNAAVRDAPEMHFLRARAGTSFGDLDAQLFVDNLLNNRTLHGDFRYATGSPLVTYRIPRPRTVGLTLIYRTR